MTDDALRGSGFDSLANNPVNLSSIFDALFEGLYFVDSDRRIQEWSAGAVALTGFSADEVRQRCCADNILMHVDENGRELCHDGCPLQATLIDGKTRESRVFLRHKQGYRVPIAVRTVPVRDSNANIIGAFETFREVGEADHWKARISELERAVQVDSLTDVPNRRFLESQIARLLREFRSTSECFTVLLIDVDRFKSVNDTMGHDAGDRVLKTISQTLMNSLRQCDIVGRWGGDEFVMLLGATNREQSETIAARLCKLVAQTATPTRAGHVRLTISTGGAVSAPNDTLESLLKHADEQLYLAKQRGRNGWAIA
jgi:diguanylate cyclase (GGDEF)-like protein/PAS domain S-box-containing protein